MKYGSCAGACPGVAAARHSGEGRYEENGSEPIPGQRPGDLFIDMQP